MSLKLYFHPLSSFCHKVLIALYENNTPFQGQVVMLNEEKSRDDFLKIWPIGKFPVLRDDARNHTVPESSIIIEYLDQHYPGKTRFLPADPDLARQARMHDRFIDLHIHMSMQKIITDRFRPEGKHDPAGVDQARTLMNTGLGMLEQDMAAKSWIMGDVFGLADCAVAPALFYVNMAIEPLANKYPNLVSYLERLKARPSYARALKEAEPFLHLVPR